MHVQLASDAPLLLRVIAGSALVMHIGGAGLGIGSGVAALIVRKGGRLHRIFGTTFFVSMLTMSAMAAITAPLLPDRFSAMMGVFVFYLTLTAWTTVRRRPGQVGRLEGAGAILGAATLLGFAVLAVIASRHPGFVLDRQPGMVAFVVVPLAAMAVAFDLKLIRAGGIAGPARTARHLWRMCLALLIAEGSALAQPKVTQFIAHDIQRLLVWGVGATLAAMIYWLVKTRWPRRRRPAAPLPATA